MLYSINQAVQMLNISVNLKDTKKVDLIYFGKLRRFQSFLGALYVIYQLSDIKDDIQVISSFLCLLEHLV